LNWLLDYWQFGLFERESLMTSGASQGVLARKGNHKGCRIKELLHKEDTEQAERKKETQAAIRTARRSVW